MTNNNKNINSSDDNRKRDGIDKSYDDRTQDNVNKSDDDKKKNNINQSAGNILVVDDNPQNLRLLIAILGMEGYKVRPAPSGAIALQSAFSTLPDLILLDLMMPEMDGYETCQRLKENQLTNSVPIIFISAVNSLEEKVKAFEVGAVDYITKPFQAAEVLARVNTHIALRRTQKMLEDEIELRKESEEQLRVISLKYQQLATQDFLTGVSNRRFFMERAEEEVNRAQRYHHSITFLMMDIDHFKKINDTYGHQAGDVVLKKVAMTCIDNLRLNDIFGRIGGEEFAALLPETNINEALIVAERIRKSIESACWDIENMCVTCTISIGMSQLADDNNSNLKDNSDAHSLDQLMKKADEALYRAKSSGRNCIIKSLAAGY